MQWPFVGAVVRGDSCHEETPIVRGVVVRFSITAFITNTNEDLVCRVLWLGESPIKLFSFG